MCNLSEEEFKLLESKITRYGNLDRLISSPRHDTYVSCRFMITRDSDYSKILFADYDNPRKEVHILLILKKKLLITLKIVFHLQSIMLRG